MSVPFLAAKPDVTWVKTSRAWHGTIDGVELACESRWWGKQWNVTAQSAFPIAEKMILFVSERGMDHGFWRDLLLGDPAFDARFFIFCDTPALLPIVLGAATRKAMSQRLGELTLYVRDGRVRTTGMNGDADVTAIDRHLAIHRALASDHATFLHAWQERMDDAAGRADPTWPPTATLLRPSGALLVNLAWTAPTSRDASDWDEAAASMRTELTAYDDRERKKWSLREVGPTVACTHVLAQRRFVLVGTLPFTLPVLDGIIGRSQIAAIAVYANRITVGLHGIATAHQLEGAVRIIQLVVEATVDSSSPYR